jgi:hypothetical protein
VQDHTQPQGNAKAEFLRLVPKGALPQQDTRPAATNRQQVQGVFGHPASTPLSLSLVVSEGGKRDQTQNTGRGKTGDGTRFTV